MDLEKYLDQRYTVRKTKIENATFLDELQIDERSKSIFKKVGKLKSNKFKIFRKWYCC